MILKKIIRIASNTENYGLSNEKAHKATVKNKTCGDKISIEITLKNNKMSKMRYETESCIYCEASASLLSKKIKMFSKDKIRKQMVIFNNFIQINRKSLPKKYKDFKDLMNHRNLNRIDCIMLPYNALLKAVKIKK